MSLDSEQTQTNSLTRKKPTDSVPSKSDQTTKSESTDSCNESWKINQIWSQEVNGKIEGIYTHPSYLLVDTNSKILLLNYSGVSQWQTKSSGNIAGVLGDTAYITKNNTLMSAKIEGQLIKEWTFDPFKDGVDDRSVVAIDDVEVSEDEIYMAVSKTGRQGIQIDDPFKRIYSIEAETGEVSWKIDDQNDEGINTRSLFWDNGHIYVFDKEGILTRYSREGDMSWETTISGGKPYVRNDKSSIIIVGTEGREANIHAVDSISGEIIWSRVGFNRCYGSYNDYIIVSGDGSTKTERDIRFAAINTDDGKTAWEVEINSGTAAGPGIVDNGHAYVSTINSRNNTRRYHLIRINDGCKIGDISYRGNHVATPVISRDQIIIAGGNNTSTVVRSLNPI